MKEGIAEGASSQILEDEAEVVAFIAVGWDGFGEIGLDEDMFAQVFVDLFLTGEHFFFKFLSLKIEKKTKKIHTENCEMKE